MAWVSWQLYSLQGEESWCSMKIKEGSAGGGKQISKAFAKQASPLASRLVYVNKSTVCPRATSLVPEDPSRRRWFRIVRQLLVSADRVLIRSRSASVQSRSCSQIAGAQQSRWKREAMFLCTAGDLTDWVTFRILLNPFSVTLQWNMQKGWVCTVRYLACLRTKMLDQRKSNASCKLREQQSHKFCACHTVWDGCNKILIVICVRLPDIMFESCLIMWRMTEEL